MNRDAAPPAPSAVVGCGGDGCDARDPWPLHHVRHRGVYCRLCTSCVLRYNAGSFCSACFDFFPSAVTAAAGGLVHCVKCTAVAHIACLPGGGTSYLCPACSAPKGFAYSPAPALSKTHHNVIDLPTAKVLFAASQISSLSMNRASTGARAEAERKAREAAFARKRARDMLEEAVSVCIKEKEKKKESLAVTVANGSSVNALSKAAAEPPKKKAVRIGGGAAADATATKKFQDRQREKLMRFQEPIQVPVPVVTPIQMMPYQPHARMEANKAPPVNNVHSRVGAEARGMDSNLAQPNSNIAQMEKETRGLLLSPQEATGLKAGEIDKGGRVTKPTQDGSVSRMNNRAIVTVPPDSAGLHS